jgi:hypothetical protein
MAARSIDAVEYSTFTNAIDLFSVYGRDIERVVVIASTDVATMSVKTRGNTAAHTIAVLQGESIDVQIRSIESVANITKIRVHFSEF